MYNSNGILFSSDDGEDWSFTNASTGLPNVTIDALFIDVSYIYAGAALGTGVLNAGVWRRPLSDFGISSVTQTPVQIKPKLHIYPNPFSQSTQITFTLQAAGYEEVSIVNMLGVEVARLFSGELGAGEHSFLWGKPTGLPELPDGMYECLVRMNGQVETLPILLLH
jgi:hypothetical protein